MHHFLAASDYYLGYSDSDNGGTYDPTREFFHVGLGMPGVGEDDEGAGSRSSPHPGTGAATPPCIVLPAARNENLAPT
jgi:hypothetical protein